MIKLLKNKGLKNRVKKALEANPSRNRRSSKKTTKGGKHSGLSSSQRRRNSIKVAELEAIRNPWMSF